MIDTKRLGSQIRLLRKAFGETQLELSMALGYDSPSTISMYESGMRGRRGRDSYDVISRLARHFRITEDALFHKDFSGADYLAIPIEKPETIGAHFLKLLPIQELQEKRCSEEDRKICLDHADAARDLVRTMRFREQKFRTFINNYSSLPYWDRSKEILANMLWWVTVRDLFYSYPMIPIGLKKVWMGQISKKEFYRDYYLVNATADGKHDPVNADKKRNLSPPVHHDDADGLLRLLYKAPGGIYLAEYYAAFRIRYALTATSKDKAAHMEVGAEMIKMLAEIGNPYAAEHEEAANKLHIV